MNQRKGSLSLGSTLSNYPLLLIKKGRFGKSLCDEEISDGRDRNQRQEAVVPPAVEHIGTDEQKGVLIAVAQPPIDGQHECQEDEELEGVEDHLGRARRCRAAASTR